MEELGDRVQEQQRLIGALESDRCVLLANGDRSLSVGWLWLIHRYYVLLAHGDRSLSIGWLWLIHRYCVLLANGDRSLSIGWLWLIHRYCGGPRACVAL